jgi:hypothetical protein
MNDDRRNAIVRLLGIRYEHLPTPVRRVEIASGFVHGGLDKKGQHKRWLTCPDCLTNDKVMFGCETCGGRGRIPDAGRDPMSKSKDVVPYGADGSRHDLAYARDRQIETLRQQTRPAAEVDEAADAKANPYAWERARARLYAKYDLAVLEREIEWLRLHFPGVKLRGGCRGNGPSGCFALGYLDMVLPDPLRAPGSQPPVQLATGRVARAAGPDVFARRDAEICRAVLEAKIPTGDVARTWGLSVSQVNKIVSQAA